MHKIVSICFLLALSPLSLVAEGASPVYGVDTSNDASAGSMSGGNVFDFSGGVSVPNAPALSSFAGGPCTGSGFTGSTAVPGFSVGASSSELDESCQRRNWVQTIIGASQHMGADEAKVMLRLAIEVMREDEYLAGPMERIGLQTASIEGFNNTVRIQQELAEARQTSNAEKSGGVNESDRETVLFFERGCVIEVNEIPKGFAALLLDESCIVKKMGES